MTGAAARQRRHRERLAAGRTVLPVEVNLAAVSLALVDAGYLKEWDDADPAAIRDAVEDLLSDMGAEYMPPPEYDDGDA